jgi:hypothetical protein
LAEVVERDVGDTTVFESVGGQMSAYTFLPVDIEVPRDARIWRTSENPERFAVPRGAGGLTSRRSAVR